MNKIKLTDLTHISTRSMEEINETYRISFLIRQYISNHCQMLMENDEFSKDIVYFVNENQSYLFSEYRPDYENAFVQIGYSFDWNDTKIMDYLDDIFLIKLVEEYVRKTFPVFKVLRIVTP